MPNTKEEILALLAEARRFTGEALELLPDIVTDESNDEVFRLVWDAKNCLDDATATIVKN